MPDLALIPALSIFGDINDGHQCCECCDGYCPMTESDGGLPLLYAFTMNGTEYVSDRYIAVRADILAERGEPIARQVDKAWPLPDVEPGPSTAILTPSKVQRLTACGIDIREGLGTQQELYRNGVHVGWLAKCSPAEPAAARNPLRGKAMTLDMVPAVMAYVAESANGWHVQAVGNSWDIAASILNEARWLGEQHA
jgi:hypothetical protein